MQHPQAFRLDFTPLRRRRRELEITQGRLAEEAGVSRSTVCRTEANQREREVRVYELTAMARALGTPRDGLYRIEEVD